MTRTRAFKGALALLLIATLGTAGYWAVSVTRLITRGDGRALGPPPHALAFDFAGHTPRFLHAWGQTTTPVEIINTGTRAWNADRVYVSYHWLSLIPRELPNRLRWTLPYHEGVRTELGGDVQPGAQLAVDGRLVAPRWPGLYWLQWDMVEEGTTWFSQVSPFQPRQLVVVLPTPAGLATPLPLLVALAALGAVLRTRQSSRRPARFVAIGDVVWCAAVLAAKPLLLVRDAHLEPTAAAYGLMVVVAIVPPLLCAALLPRRVRVWVLWSLGSIGTLVILGDELYYRFFDNVLSATVLLEAQHLGQIWSSIGSLFTPDLLWFVLDIPVAVGLGIALTRQPATVATGRSGQLAAAAAMVVGIAGALLAIQAVQAQPFSARAMMERLGPFGYHIVDAWTVTRWTVVRPVITNEQKTEIRTWFADRASWRAGTGPFFAAAAGRNLIVVQVEALQDFAVDYRVNDEPVMPHLARWSERGLRFTNVTDQTSMGRTSDAEFATLVSLPPLDDGAVAFRFAANRYVGLPSVLAEHGYTTLSAIPFEPGFWNRQEMFPAYGFQHSLFESDFEMTEQIGWGLNDHDFLQQVVPRLSTLPRPFAAWLITLSLHHPFDEFPDGHKVLKMGSLEGTSLGNYLHAMHFVDRALADFETALARAGLLDDSMLVVFGDHDAGFPRELGAGIGIGADPYSWELGDRVPLLMGLPQAQQPLPGVVSVVAGQIDLAPTLLALLGIDPARLPYMGRNLLGQPEDQPVLRPNGHWLDRTHLFRGSHGTPRDRSCFALELGRFVDATVCRTADGDARRARDIARLVVIGDLQPWLRSELRVPAN